MRPTEEDIVGPWGDEQWRCLVLSLLPKVMDQLDSILGMEAILL